jgi:hypothetical protein
MFSPKLMERTARSWPMTSSRGATCSVLENPKMAGSQIFLSCEGDRALGAGMELAPHSVDRAKRE